MSEVFWLKSQNHSRHSSVVLAYGGWMLARNFEKAVSTKCKDNQ